MQASNHSPLGASALSRFPLLSVSEAAEKLGVSASTLRNWSNSGEFPVVTLPSGHRRYRMEDVLSWMGEEVSKEGANGCDGPRCALVARVSSNKQSKGYAKGEASDLTRQESRLWQYAKERWGYEEGSPNISMFTRTSSGMNFDCPVFCSLVRSILAQKFAGGYIVAVHSERIARFALSFFKLICEFGHCEVVIIGDEDAEKDAYESLTEDLLAILCHFSARTYGARAAETTTKRISPACVERMIALRQSNYGVVDIARQLTVEGFKMGTGEDETSWDESPSEWVISKYLDANGVETALTVVCNVKRSGESPLDGFLAEQVDRTDSKTDRIPARSFRERYEAYCNARSVQPEAPARLGQLLSERGIRRCSNGGVRTLTGIRFK